MAKPFDTATKQLVEDYPSDWLRLLGFATDVPVAVIDADLSTVQAEADKVLRIGGDEPWIAHVEFQTTYDPHLSGRLLRYNVLLDDRHHLPVRSAVILLRPLADGPAISGEYRRSVSHRDEHLVFRYDVIRVWEVPVDEILIGPVGTLPLAPVSDVNEKRLPSVIFQMEQRVTKELSRASAATLWTTTFLLLGLSYSPTLAASLLKGVSDMKESSTYQWIVEQGRIEEAHSILLRIGRKQFGEPSQSVVAELESIRDLARLEELTDRVLDVSNWQELLNGQNAVAAGD